MGIWKETCYKKKEIKERVVRWDTSDHKQGTSFPREEFKVRAQILS